MGKPTRAPLRARDLALGSTNVGANPTTLTEVDEVPPSLCRR